jgi:hypothetical protein
MTKRVFSAFAVGTLISRLFLLFSTHHECRRA